MVSIKVKGKNLINEWFEAVLSTLSSKKFAENEPMKETSVSKTYPPELAKKYSQYIYLSIWF